MDDGGIVLIRFPERFAIDSERQPSEQLIEHASEEINDESVALRAIKYDDFRWHSGSILELSYQGIGWRDIGGVIFSCASNIEFCSCYSDEYGGIDLICLTASNERQRLIFDHAGDDMSSQEYRDQFTEKYNKWKSMISNDIAKLLPDCYFNSADYFY